MKLTKEQKEELINVLSFPFGHVKLLCDGYEISLNVRRVKANSIVYRTFVFINGYFEHKWAIAKEGEYQETKFLRKLVRPNVSPKQKAALEKKLGKRFVKNHPFFGGSSTFYLPDWGSGKTAINHLCKVCESISIVEKTMLSEII